MTVWQYVACDVLTGAELADLPLSSVKLTRQLNGAGPATATLAIGGQSDVVRRVLLDAVDPGRRALYALADGIPVWGGMIWQAPRSTFALSAAEWGAYFGKVALQADLEQYDADQLDLARALLASAQGQPNGNVRVAVDSTTSGVLRDLALLAGDLPVVGEQLDSLANLDGGFDYAWPVERDAAGLLCGRLRLGYPKLGRDDALLSIESPGGTRDLPGYELDASGLATTSFAVGAGGVVASASDPALLAAGYPVLHRIERYSDTADEGDLTAHAVADQQAYGGTLVTITATVGLDVWLSGDLQLGDSVHVELHDYRFPDPFTGDLRCTAAELDPQAGTAALTLSPRVAVGGRIPRGADADARLAQLDREVRYLAVSG